MARGRGQALPQENPVYRYSGTFFVAFLVFAILAFWPNYLSRPLARLDPLVHAHGIAMFLWVFMLITQARLIRTRRRPRHRSLGALSYVLAPVLVVSTIMFVHETLSRSLAGVSVIPPRSLLNLALMLNATVLFGVIYGLAMYYRRDSQRHARYMVCTLFPLFTPVTDRLIAFHAQGVRALMPTVDGGPVVPFAGFLLADAMVIALAIWDWRRNRRLDVFPVVLGLLLVYHVSVMTLHLVPAWHAFAVWFLSLPLS
jgi:hypothetical protein